MRKLWVQFLAWDPSMRNLHDFTLGCLASSHSTKECMRDEMVLLSYVRACVYEEAVRKTDGWFWTYYRYLPLFFVLTHYNSSCFCWVQYFNITVGNI